MLSNTASDLAIAAIRISTGILFLAHGWLKLSVFTIAGTVAFFESLGLPGIFAYLTIFAELAGGLALVLGVATRLVSAALLPILLGAVWAHWGAGWVFSNEGGGWEFPMFWAVVQGALVGLGSGALALKIPGAPHILAKVS